jgi:hypothetical protein
MSSFSFRRFSHDSFGYAVFMKVVGDDSWVTIEHIMKHAKTTNGRTPFLKVTTNNADGAHSDGTHSDGNGEAL